MAAIRNKGRTGASSQREKKGVFMGNGCVLFSSWFCDFKSLTDAIRGNETVIAHSASS
jgi:hypothetical protein